MSIELGGFAEDETAIDGDYEIFNKCLAEEYLGAFETEDIEAIGEISSYLLDNIIGWLSDYYKVQKCEINNGSLMTYRNRTIIDWIVDEHHVNMADTYIGRGIINPELYLICILYGDLDMYAGVLNNFHYFIDEREQYIDFLNNIFKLIDQEYQKIESSDDQLKFLKRIKEVINSTRYPKEYGIIKFSDITDDNVVIKQLIKEKDKSSKN